MATREQLATIPNERLADKLLIERISDAVYSHQLGPEATAHMRKVDNDDGKKFRSRAGQYDKLTRTYMKVLRDMKLLKEG